MYDYILSFFFFKERIPPKFPVIKNTYELLFKFYVVGESTQYLWVARNLHSLFSVLCFLATVFFEWAVSG